jgi:hypothetical protein
MPFWRRVLNWPSLFEVQEPRIMQEEIRTRTATKRFFEGICWFFHKKGSLSVFGVTASLQVMFRALRPRELFETGIAGHVFPRMLAH